MHKTIALTVLALVGCGPNHIGNSDAGASDAGAQFQCPNSALVYPAGPYGITQHSTFPDFVLGGGYFGSTLSTTSPALPDIPNPGTPSPNFTTSMAFHQLFCAQQAGFKYALIDISAYWCPHCQVEAQELPKTWVPTCPAGQNTGCGWQSRGGLVLSFLEQDTQGNPATLDNLNQWVNTYGVNYPMSMNPQETMATGITLQGWPANIIIKLSDMTVVDAMFGATDTFFWEFDSLLPPGTVRALFFAAMGALAACASTPPPGERGGLPGFELNDLEGGSVRLDDHLGKDVIYLDFWASWCEPCKAQMPQLEALYERYHARGFIVLGVAMDDPTTASQIAPAAHQMAITFPVLLDSQSKAVGLYNPARSAPYGVLIDRGGKVALQHSGYAPGDERMLEAEIQKSL